MRRLAVFVCGVAGVVMMACKGEAPSVHSVSDSTEGTEVLEPRDTFAVASTSVLLDGRHPWAGAPTDVVSGRIGEDGRVLLLDGGTASVVVLTDSGALVTRFGGRGRGPGEFSRPMWMGLLRDSAGVGVLVWDATPGKLTRFDYSGAYGETISVDPRRTAQRDQPFMGVLSDQRIPLVLNQTSIAPETPVGLFRPTIRVEVFDWAGLHRGQVMETEGSELYHYEQNGRRAIVEPALHDRLLTAVAGDLVWIANTKAGRVRAITGDGVLRLDVSLGTPRPLADASAVDRAIQEQAIGGPPSIAAIFEEAWREAPRPKVLPVLVDLVGASGGEVWVALYDDDSSAWLRLGAAGAVDARLALAKDERILDQRGKLVLTLSLDELDRPTVRLHHID